MRVCCSSPSSFWHDSGYTDNLSLQASQSWFSCCSRFMVTMILSAPGGVWEFVALIPSNFRHDNVRIWGYRLVNCGIVAMAGCTGCRSVSKIGPSMPAPASMATAMRASNVYIVIVVALAVSGFLCLCMFILILRSHRRASRRSAESMSTPETTERAEVVVAEKNGLGDEDSRSKWGVNIVELVVMAGEDRPTFVAHPAAAAAAAHVVECPPLQQTPISPCKMWENVWTFIYFVISLRMIDVEQEKGALYFSRYWRLSLQ